ncbi:MAG: sigma-54-dependent Fis family transcriptional regulator [Clostridia bacterium]|nr:sigma-54-dependent Fis family transcriptional regulator [Clostridia bacterium]
MYEVSKQELSVILNSTHDGMLAVNAQGIVTIFNAAAEEITGLKAEDLIGKAVQEVIPNTRLHIILHTNQMEVNQQQKLGSTTIVTNRVPVRDEQGKVIGAVAIFRDIGEILTLAEEITNLKQMKTLLSAIINSTQDAISVVDENGMGIMINPAYTRLTGLTEGEVINRPATVDIVEGESTHYQVLRTQKPVRGVRLKVGPYKKEVMVNVAPIVVDGKLKGSVGVIHDLSEIRKLTEELETARRIIRQLEAKYSFDDIVGSSDEIMAATQQALRTAAISATVLLRGESGTGKELFAHAIHNASQRYRGKFIRVNCAALSESLLESELFGYEQGAFSGASKGGKVGLFEEANGGTIFLDEIGEVNPSIQAKLLRVIQEKEIIRVGGTKALPVDVRVIAATNANLEQKIKEGTFREDLYYRLNVVPIFIPPLRRRKSDIPGLAYFLISKFNQEYGRKVEGVQPQALEILAQYDWPGNIRELENILGRAIINMRYNEDIIMVYHLPALGNHPVLPKQELQAGAVSITAGEVYGGQTLEEMLDQVEKQILLNVLDQCGGNKTLAARKLNIAIRSLYYKLEKHGIK